MRVEVFSDIACPWCYVGQVRFERALSEYAGMHGTTVLHCPYQLNPGLPEEPQPLLDYYVHRYGTAFRDRQAAVADVASTEGLKLHLQRALAVNTFTAHRLLWLAEHEYGAATQRDVKHALMRTYLTDGGDTADRETLAALAAQAGMDRDRVRTALAGDTGAAEVREGLRLAQDLGIRSVPTFVFDGRYIAQGAQDVAVFRRVLEQLRAEGQTAGSERVAPVCAKGARTA
ncbi:polyketide synthase [Streptomyces spiroverticillatus]|uniref:Polyketide synthase n=1 Tax=Streptomyces finlayi TaxID=67296 RepID=A0A919CEQ4_9ACTN|nr:DsbA family oxidoreductase [Streptomyces finlayi]GHA49228.1 polyketide synthase [Streptomyces spiroverticillatus]GHD13661.1 polyketide synthase [Streptomyces finlayi]